MLNKQRLFFFMVLFSSILVLSGCGNKAVAEVEGYEKYSNERLAFGLQYPEDWLLADESYYTDSFQKAAALDRGAAYGLSQEKLEDALDSCSLVAYDVANQMEQIFPNMSLLVQNQPGLRRDGFKDEEYQQRFYEQMMEELSVVSTPTPLAEPEGKSLGNNYYFVMSYKYTIFEQTVATYQACTVDDNSNVFIFTFTAAPDQLEAYLETFDQILATVSFQ